MNTELITNTTDIAFADIREQLAVVAEENKSLVFDYSTEEGEKAAKKQIRSLRKLDKRVGEIHKEIKADALAQCRLIDSVKRDLVAEIAEMVAVHKEPLERKAAEEAERVQAIADRIALIVSYDEKFEGVTESVKIEEGIATLEAIEITADGYQERMAEACNLKDSILTDLRTQLELAKKAEAEAAELAELRRQKEERERKEREKRIAAEAAEAARKEAEAKALQAEADAAAALQAEKDRAKREAEEAAERERKAIEAKKQAEAEAKRAKEEDELQERERQAKAIADAEAAEAKRLADEKHVSAVRLAAAEDIASKCGVSIKVAQSVVGMIESGEISSVSIKF